LHPVAQTGEARLVRVPERTTRCIPWQKTGPGDQCTRSVARGGKNRALRCLEAGSGPRLCRPVQRPHPSSHAVQTRDVRVAQGGTGGRGSSTVADRGRPTVAHSRNERPPRQHAPAQPRRAPGRPVPSSASRAAGHPAPRRPLRASGTSRRSGPDRMRLSNPGHQHAGGSTRPLPDRVLREERNVKRGDPRRQLKWVDGTYRDHAVLLCRCGRRRAPRAIVGDGISTGPTVNVRRGDRRPGCAPGRRTGLRASPGCGPQMLPLVSQALLEPCSYPTLNQWPRCTAEPCVHDSGFTWP
jgi:hypothetical protein